MNQDNLTHYRKAFNSPYLSSADVTEPVVLTIKMVRLEAEKTNRKKGEMVNTAYFANREIRAGEKLKPMILNATNSKMMAQITGSPFLEHWQNVQVEVYVENNIKFGKESVDGLRIRPIAYRPPFDLEETLTAITNAETYEQAYQICMSHWGSISPQEREAIKQAVSSRKDATTS